METGVYVLYEGSSADGKEEIAVHFSQRDEC